jgi:hypothetical protein
MTTTIHASATVRVCGLGSPAQVAQLAAVIGATLGSALSAAATAVPNQTRAHLKESI